MAALAAARRVYYGWALVLTLGITETVSWGVLYYAFTVFIAPMQAELGWSRGQTTGALSLALLLSGLAAYPVGRWQDRHGPRLLMTAGACAAVLLVLAWSQVRSLAALYLVWALIGLAMSAVLYQPAFAVVATWFARRRTQALTVLTIMAGWASIIFVPLATWLILSLGWRAALVALALVLAGVTIPAHALLLRRRPEDLGLGPDGEPIPATGGAERRSRTVAAPSGAALGWVVRQRPIRWLAVAFCLAGFSETAITVHMVPLLLGHGFSAGFAAWAVGLVGLSALLGRLLFAPFGDRLPQERAAALIFALQALALLVLLALGGAVAGVFAFVVLFGAGRGMTTLVRANAVAALYGRARYASIAGVLAACIVAAQSAAPLAAGAAYDALGRYDPLLGALAVTSLLAAAAVLRAGAPEVTEIRRAYHG